MKKEELTHHIQTRKSYLCVGLDSEKDKLPPHLLKEKDPVFSFNKQIIDATLEHCIAYKFNIAFYESLGSAGWESLSKTLKYIPESHFTIADAKRGDIGNTSGKYARTYFKTYDFDAVTVNPYMGKDSIMPFLEYNGKWTIILALTSNPGAKDFQVNGKPPLYQKVLTRASQWGTPENIMFVAGATRLEELRKIREICPGHFLLVPGVGTQGGDLQQLSRHGLNSDGGMLVNVSRKIIFSNYDRDFAQSAGVRAAQYHQKMKQIMEDYYTQSLKNE